MSHTTVMTQKSAYERQREGLDIWWTVIMAHLLHYLVEFLFSYPFLPLTYIQQRISCHINYKLVTTAELCVCCSQQQNFGWTSSARLIRPKITLQPTCSKSHPRITSMTDGFPPFSLFFFRRPQLHCNGRHRHGNLADALIRGVVITFLSRHYNNFGAIRWTFWIRNFFSLTPAQQPFIRLSFLVIILTLLHLLVWISDQINLSAPCQSRKEFSKIVR